MTKKRRFSPRPRADINITPLIDVLLVLIVIFMVITPVPPRGFQTQVPSPAPTTTLEREDTLILSADRDGNIRLNREDLDAASVFPRLQAVFSTRSDRTIFIQADDEVQFSDVAQLIDAARGAGADRVGLMNERIAAH